ncbi:MAG: hypothetical protein C0483_04170 [Pirellula sp.]|nr:hypothetical protein [Pirellula sp.]
MPLPAARPGGDVLHFLPFIHPELSTMHLSWLLAGLMSLRLLSSAAITDDRQASPVPAQLVGTWKVVEVVSDGAPLAERYRYIQHADGKLEVWDGDKLVMKGLAKYDVAAKRSPAKFEFRPTQYDDYPEMVGQKHLGIYRLDGDTYEECIAVPTAPRPKQMKSVEGTFETYVKYQRVLK